MGGRRQAGARGHLGGVAALDGRRLGGFTIRLGLLRPARRTGWWTFSLVLEDGQHRRSGDAIVDGVHSVGGKGVAPWVEMSYRTRVSLAGRRIDLRRRGLEGHLLAEVGRVVPPGGHLMVEYETEPHRETYAGLARGIPPALTPLGALLVEAGFTGPFKVWYFAEGGLEGPVKLQANRPPSPAAVRRERGAQRAEVEAFLRATAHHTGDALVAAARTRAKKVLAAFEGRGGRARLSLADNGGLCS